VISNHLLSLQEYIRREVKPTSKNQLIKDIMDFWSTVTPEKCQRYISHIRKVIPKMIETQGAGTGY